MAPPNAPGGRSWTQMLNELKGVRTRKEETKDGTGQACTFVYYTIPGQTEQYLGSATGKNKKEANEYASYLSFNKLAGMGYHR